MREDKLIADNSLNAVIFPSTAIGSANPEVKVEPVFGIRVGSVGLLVSADRFCEVLDKMQVNPIPNLHPWISGLLNLRGNLVPIYDLKLVLRETGENNKRFLFAIDKGEKAIALWIDNYPEIKDKLVMKPVRQLPKLPDIFQRFVIGGYEHSGQVWLDVKFEDLFKTLGRHQYTSEGMAT